MYIVGVYDTLKLWDTVIGCKHGMWNFFSNLQVLLVKNTKLLEELNNPDSVSAHFL